MKKYLIFLTCSLLLSCSQIENKGSGALGVEPIPQWLKVEPRFAHLGPDGFYTVHSFFDFAPFPDLKTNKINFVMTTPVGSKFGYDINLHSGQIYRRHNYCPQDDVWNSYSGKIKFPPYSEGFVPRVLDQLGKPLKVLVFGGKKYLSKSGLNRPLSQRIRVVGGVIQQYCENFPCARNSGWLSRLVLLAVNHKDPSFKKIISMTQLKSKIDWNQFKAFFENGYGRQIKGIDERPAFRMLGGVGAKEALQYALSKGHLFKFKEMKKLRDGCHRLYDFMWKKAKQLRANVDRANEENSREGRVNKRSLLVDVKKSIFNVKKNKKKIKKIKKKKLKVAELEKELGGPKSFKAFFDLFYRPYGEKFLTCTDFVRSSNALINKERHWFFAYLEAFMNLEKLGYVYHCSKRAWVRNSFLANGERQYNKFKIKKNCLSSDLESSFDMGITLLSSLKGGSSPHDYYVLYDQGHGGSHNRLYSWVESDGKKVSCKKKVIDYRNEEFFPRDVTWDSFGDE